MSHKTLSAFICGLLAALLLTLLGGCNGDTKARVRFDNQSGCGTITATLTDETSGQVQTVKIDNNVQQIVELKPDVYYDYVVDFTTAGTAPDKTTCPAVKSGKVRVPAGQTQTFVLRAEPPTAIPNK